MPLAIINDLEDKLGQLIAKLNSLKQESEELRDSLQRKDQEINELREQAKGSLSAAESAKADAEDQKQKLDAAAKRIAELINKLEAVE